MNADIETREVCQACSVVLCHRGSGRDKVTIVEFSHGKPGTLSRLWARVCQYAKNPGCINTINLDNTPITSCDHYG